MSWKYEILFDVADMEGLTPLEKQARIDNPDRWKTEKADLKRKQMGYRTKTTKAGPRLEAEIFPTFGRGADQEAREAKSHLTPEKIQQHNDEKARRYLVQLMDANFTEGDLSLTLTYRENPGPNRMEKDIRNFVDRLRRYRAKRGLPELKYIYALEWTEDGQQKRPHCHFITQGDITAEELKEIWGRDVGFCNVDELQPDRGRGLEALARYIYNQNHGIPREKGKRKYSVSKNLKKPKTRISNTKVSKGGVKRMSDVFEADPAEARRIMEKLYPGYEYVQGSTRRSDVFDGVYIRVLMRKKAKEAWGR